MLNTCNKFKLVLSKIKIAQCNYKKILKLKISSIDFILLNILWKEGFIFGYSKIKQFYFIFLKYNLQGIGLLSSIDFMLILVTKKELNNFKLIDPLCNFLVMTSKGLKLYFQKNLLADNGGFLLAKF